MTITSLRALVSVSDKTNLIPFCAGLRELGISLLSTGGTASFLRDNGIPAQDIAAYTGSPEIFDGRVKTLHPKIHGGILFDRNNASHQQEREAQGIEAIDLVVVNLYPFAKEAAAKDLPLPKAIEFIDIGGPTLLRAAAKNFATCLPVCRPADYPRVLQALKAGAIPQELRRALAAKVFQMISHYDAMIAACFSREFTDDFLPPDLTNLSFWRSLDYGENPHQRAAAYEIPNTQGLSEAEFLHGQKLSYNNLLDLDAACRVVQELSPQTAVAIIKHTNPCGVAVTNSLPVAAFKKAFACDPVSAFGGIVACNQSLDREFAAALADVFIECIIAPGYDEEALNLLQRKKKLRILRWPALNQPLTSGLELRRVSNLLLTQASDVVPITDHSLSVVTTKKPTAAEREDLIMAMRVARQVKSNAIVYAHQHTTLGIGAGQMSRIDAARFGAEKAQAARHNLRGSVLASDAFFPFRDCVDFAHELGVAAIIQPGGSIRDEESIAACNEHGISMVFTGNRHFKH